jgi:hypothetical protein
MTNKNFTDITLILDRSGSMDKCKTDTEGGFDSFIDEQKKVAGKCNVTLVQFDDQYDVVYSNKPISEVPKCVLVPRGSTALLDAIGKTIVSTGERLAAMPENERPGAVIVAILTDGGENASHEYNWSSVKKLIDKQTNDYQWLFTFIGANQDAIANASKMGIGRSNSMTYDVHNTGQVFASLATSTTNYRHATAAGASYGEAVLDAAFTDEDRKKAVSTP